MVQKHKKEIEAILNGLQCSKDFVCYTSGLKKVCRAEDIGLETFLVCLEENPKACNFFVSFGGKHFCQCPLRVYIAKKLRN